MKVKKQIDDLFSKSFWELNCVILNLHSRLKIEVEYWVMV